MTRIATNGVELAVQVIGSGPPIVMVHGSLDDHRAQDRVTHADAWLDQSRDPDRLAVRPELLASYPHRVVISHGDAGPATPHT